MITSQNDTAPKPNDVYTRTSTSLITSQNDTAPKLERLPKTFVTSLITSQNDTAPKLAGIEHGGQFVGTSPSKVKLVSTLKLKSGVIAQAERRGEDVIIRFNANRLRGMTQDQVEQIAFHEMAHTAENRIVSDSQFAKEVENLLAFQSDAKRTLPKPKASERLENALQNAGFNAEYDPKSGG